MTPAMTEASMDGVRGRDRWPDGGRSGGRRARTRPWRGRQRAGDKAVWPTLISVRDLGELWLLDPDNELHLGEGDEICPRCLREIRGRDYVRRTELGLPVHEVCPQGLTR